MRIIMQNLKNNLIFKIIKSAFYIIIMAVLFYISPKIQDIDNKLIFMFASSITMIIIIISVIMLAKCWDDTDEPIDPYGDL